jgi:hypothetical protein
MGGGPEKQMMTGEKSFGKILIYDDDNDDDV